MPAASPASLPARLALPAGVLAAACAIFLGAAAVDLAGRSPACPVPALTGLYCPGCGGLRSAHAVAHGELATALSSNALAVVGYVALAALLVGWLVRAARAGATSVPVRGPVPRPAHAWLVAGAGLAFTVARNLPAGSALAP